MYNIATEHTRVYTAFNLIDKLRKREQIYLLPFRVRSNSYGILNFKVLAYCIGHWGVFKHNYCLKINLVLVKAGTIPPRSMVINECLDTT